MDKDKLKKWIEDFSANRIFTSAHLGKDRDLGMVFTPLMFGALKDVSQEQLADVGLVWEYMDKASSRSVNGLPMFFSCHFMHQKDWEIAHAAYQKMRKALDAIDLTKDPVDEP